MKISQKRGKRALENGAKRFLENADGREKSFRQNCDRKDEARRKETISSNYRTESILKAGGRNEMEQYESMISIYSNENEISVKICFEALLVGNGYFYNSKLVQFSWLH